MGASAENLTGVWHGLYSYPAYRSPVYFVATLIDSGAFFSGTTHESEIGELGAPLTLFAAVDGSRHGHDVAFTKTYDGTGGWSHSVAYRGTLDAEGLEIEGVWKVGNVHEGRFLMIRNRGATEEMVREVYERA